MDHQIFVDFMYAVAVGTALSRITPGVLSLDKIEMWGVLFLVVVFIEDFYRYHKYVVPALGRKPEAHRLAVEMSIVFC